VTATPDGLVPVNVSALAPCNSYGTPVFVERGYYLDVPFTCAGCGAADVWRAAQQKWWYEVMKGFLYSTATRCRTCRRREQARRADARKTHLDGLRRRRGARP
jgi:hypothetical protein